MHQNEPQSPPHPRALVASLSLVAMPGAPSSVLVTSSDACGPSKDQTDQKQQTTNPVCVCRAHAHVTSLEPHAGVTDRVVCALTAVEPTTSPHIPALVGML